MTRVTWEGDTVRVSLDRYATLASQNSLGSA
jgi:hypothetical protein